MRGKWILIAVVVLVLLVVVAVAALYVILSSYDFNSLKPQIAQATKDATGRELTMTGDIKFKLGFRPTVFVDDVRFQNAPWGSQDDLASIKRFEVQVALLPLIGGNIQIKRLIMIEPDIIVETDKSGRSNLQFEKEGKAEKPEVSPPAKGEMALPALSIDKMVIENGHFVYKDGKSGKTYAVRLDRLDASTPGMGSTVKLNLKGTYDNKPFDVEGTTGPIAAVTDANKSWPINLRARAGGATITVDGSIQDAIGAKGIKLNISAEGQSIPELAKLADVNDVPDLGPFKAAVKIEDPSANTYSLSDLQMTLGANDLKGSMKLTLADKRPILTASLTSQKLDLRPLLSKKETGTEEKPEAAGKTEAQKDRVFPDDPLPLDALGLVDAQVSIKIGQILLPKVAVDDLSADIALKDGALKIQPIKAAIGGGPLDGNLELRSHGKDADLNVALKADRLDLGRMLKELDITDLIEGSVDADIEVAGDGESVADLMAGLNGKTVVVMGNGRINNKYIDLLGVDLGSGALQLLNPLGEKKDYTELNCFVSRFDIKDGLAESTALVLDTSSMIVIGEGTIHLDTEKLSISLKPAPKKGLGTEATGKMNLSLGELVKPFKLGGTLANPKLAIDTTQSAIMIGKAVGGTMLFGPVGIAAALASTSGGDKNPCLAAIEAAETGVKVADQENSEDKGAIMGATGEITEGVKSTVEGAGKTLKGLFGQSE